VIGRTHPEPNAGLFGERLWLAGQDSEISVGTGLDACQLEALRSRVAEALTAVQAPGSEGPWEYQLAGRLNAGALYRRFSEGIRRYYAIFDLSVLALYLVLGPLLSDLRFAEYQWLYPVAVIAHLIMLLQRKGTERYAAGLRYYDQRIGPMWFLLAYPALGFCLGLYAGVLMLHVLEAHWQVGVVVAAALPLLSTLVYVRAQRTAQVMPVGTGAVPGALLSWLWMVPLVAISLFHEQAVASMMAGQGHRALLFAAVSTVPISVLVYLPVRIHYFVEAPADPGNRISFAFTILSLGLGHVLLG